jgi:hypothetical protein
MSRDDFKRVSKPHYTQYVGTSHEAPGTAMGDYVACVSATSAALEA